MQANLFSDSVVESSNFEEETPFPSYAQAQTHELLARLKVAVRCPASGQGLTAVLACLCADITSLEPSVQGWRELLLACFRAQSIEHPLQLDRRIVKKTRGLQTIKLFSVAAEEFGDMANLFRSIRLKTLLNAAQLHRPISEATVQILRRARLTIDAGTDAEKWLEIFKKLDRAEWQITPAFLQPDLDRTNQARFGPAKNDSSLKTSAPTQEAHGSTEPQTQRLPLTPFEWIKGQQLFCAAKDTAGVLTGWDCYAQPEFDEAMAWLGKRLTKHNEGETSGPALLSIITGLPPMQLAQLVLSPTFDNEHPMHIEWTRGLIWFEVARLIEQAAEEPADSKEKYWSRWMATPLPVPLHFWLTNLTKAHRKRATFGEVLNRNSASLKAGTKKLLASADRPTRGLNLSFLRRSYPRRILAECRDEAYASLVGFDTTLSTSANFNYLSICPGRVWQICGRVFLVCGLGQPVKQPTLPFAGSRFLLPDNAVQRLLAKALGEARDAASTLPHKCEFDTLRAHHESITAALVLLLSLTTGHRLAKVYSYRVDALDLTLGGGAAIVSDKVTVEYHRRRIVPLTDFVVRWLRFYFSWTSVLAYRLERINRALAHQVAQVRPTHPEGESIPVLFHLSARQEFIPAGSNILNRVLLNLQTTNALGRHWLDRVLRDAGVDGASITGLMGRGIAGQELFEIHSRERIRAWLERTREPIEKKLAEFDLPTAPEISGRAMQECSLGRPRSTSVCTPERKRSGAKLEHKKLIAPTEKDASCPVDWATLFHYQAFNALVKTTRSTSRSSGAIRLIWDLALKCGLTQPEQVQAVFEAIKKQTPFQDQFGVFVDWKSPNFGLRRTYLPLSIRTLVQKHYNDIKAWPLPEAAELGAVIEVRGIPRAVIKNPLEFLCRCSHAFITIEIPSALSGWAQGRLYSRVTKPTNMALPDFPCADAQAQQLGATTRRSERSPEILELRELREALILRTGDLQSNPGLVARNRIALTRLKKIKGQQKTIAGQSVWCLLNQVLTSGAQPGTASSYLSSIVGELLVVASRISHADFTSEDGKRYFLQQLIEQLRTVENSEEESKNWTTSINHLGRSWGIQLNLKSGQEINAPPSQYAAMATPEIVQLAIDWILDQLHIPRMDRIRAATICTLHACFGARQPEVDALRIKDLLFDERGNLSHLVIHPSAGGRKTANAKRTIPIVGGKFDMASVKEWLNQRSSECAGRGRDRGDAYLFGSAQKARELASTDGDRKLIGQALETFVSGAQIDIRAFRHGVASQKLVADLSPSRKEPQDGLEARQLLVNTTNSMGHGHVSTTWRHYFHRAELLMARWLDHQLALGTLMEKETKPRSIQTQAHTRPQVHTVWKPPAFQEVARFMIEKAHGVDALVAARRSNLPDTWLSELDDVLIELGIRQLDPSAATAPRETNPWVSKVAPLVSELHVTPALVAAATRCVCLEKDYWPIQAQGDFDQLILPIVSMLDAVELMGVLTLYPPGAERWEDFAREKHWASSVQIRVANNRNRHGDQMAVRFAHRDHSATSIARHAPIVTEAVTGCVLALLVTHLLKLKFNH